MHNALGDAPARGDISTLYNYRVAGVSSWSTVDSKSLTSSAEIGAGARDRAAQTTTFPINIGTWEFDFCADQPPLPNGIILNEKSNTNNCASNGASGVPGLDNFTPPGAAPPPPIKVIAHPTATLDLKVRQTNTATYYDSATVPYNNTIDLRWTGSDVTNCRATGSWNGNKLAPSSTQAQTESPIGPLTLDSYSYTITCDALPNAMNAQGTIGGTITDTASVAVGTPTGNLSCAVSPSSAPYLMKQTSVQWSVSGAPSGSTYTWGGTVSGTGASSIPQTYDTVGTKTASVTITAPGNRPLIPPTCPAVTVTAPDLTANAPTPSLELIAGTTNEYYAGDATLLGTANNIGNASALGSFTNEYSFKFSDLNEWSKIGTAKQLADSVTVLDAYHPPSNTSNTNRPVSPSDAIAWNGTVDGVHMDIRLCADNPSSVNESNEGNNCSQRTIVVKKLPKPVLNTPTPIVAGCTQRIGGNGLAISWSNVSATSYKLIAINSNTLETRTISGITGTSYTDNNLTPGVEYRYAVSGIFGTKEGPLSDTKSAVVPDKCFDYDLSANNATVEQNKSVTTTATRTLLWGTTRQVTLSITSITAPDNSSVSGSASELSIGSGSSKFTATITSANPASPTATSNIKIDTKNSTSVGIFIIGVRGKGIETLADGTERDVVRDAQFSVSVYAKGDEPDAACSLSASPASVVSGSASTLTWNSQNASVCTGNNFSTGNATGGNVSTGALTSNQNYSLSCKNTNNTKTCDKSVTVTVTEGGGGGGGEPPPPGDEPPPNEPQDTGELGAICFAVFDETETDGDPSEDKNGDGIPNPGEYVTWNALAFNGTPNDEGEFIYDYVWSGDAPLTGKTNSGDKVGQVFWDIFYDTTGNKKGSVTVTDHGGSVPFSINCEGEGVYVENSKPANFSLSATPSTIYIERFRGGNLPESSQATITVVPQGGLSDSVSLTATPKKIQSSDVTFDFGDDSLSKNQYEDGSSFSVRLSEELPDGNYPLTITGTSGSGGNKKTRSAEVNLQVVTVKPTFEEF